MGESGSPGLLSTDAIGASLAGRDHLRDLADLASKKTAYKIHFCCIAFRWPPNKAAYARVSEPASSGPSTPPTPVAPIAPCCTLALANWR